MTESRDIDDFLNILGDKQARRILSATSSNPQSAKELSDKLDLSLPTVYRRLDLLEEQKLIIEKSRLADDGNHYRVYKCNFYSAIISLDDGIFDASVSHDMSFGERLVDLWSEL